jgi:hypothetical protein
MPKIKTESIRLDLPETVHAQHLRIEIWYNEGQFFSPLREEHYKKYEGFEHDQLKKFNLDFIQINRSKSFICITETTEAKLITKATKFYERELKTTTQSRKVIVVHFTSPTTSYGGHAYNEQHPQLALQLGLTYATEFTIGSEKSYSTEAKPRYGSSKFRIWDRDVTIIEDTKENRAWLESLYAALQNVETALTTITEDSGTLQKFISSGQKLLPNA